MTTKNNREFLINYCREHLDDYERWGQNEASQTLRRIWSVVVLLLAMNFLNYKVSSNISAGIAYLPAAIVAFVGWGLAVFAPLRLRNPTLWIDVVCCLIGLGGGLVIKGYLDSDIVVSNAPAQIILLFTGLYCFRTHWNDQMLRILGVVIGLLIPPILGSYLQKYLLSEAFIAQFIIGLVGSFMTSSYMFDARITRFFAEGMREHELQLKDLSHANELTNIQKKSLQLRVESMLALADRLNSPLTAIRTVYETVSVKNTIIVDVLEKEMENGSTKTEALQHLKSSNSRLVALGKALDVLSALAAEINEYRNSDHKIENDTISLQRTLAQADSQPIPPPLGQEKKKAA